MLKAYVSVWSADLLAMKRSLEPVAELVDGIHVDITDGHFVPELLFGPDLVAALRREYPQMPIEVHLMVTDAEAWLGRMADAGATLVTVHPASTIDLAHTLAVIADRGAKPGLALELTDPLELAATYAEVVDRILVMGTQVGIKGVDIDPATYDRVRQAIAVREASHRRPDVYVDGGIRLHTVTRIRAAGADGVIPGSLILGAPDPRDALLRLHALP